MENNLNNNTDDIKRDIKEELSQDLKESLREELKEDIKKEIEAGKPKPNKKLRLLRNIILVLLGLGIVSAIILACTYKKIISTVVQSLIYKPFEYTEEIEAELCPIDEDRAAAMDAMPHYSESDTWAFYYYVIGSNLESGTVSQLSDTTKYLISDEKEDIHTQRKEEQKLHFNSAYQMLKENSLEFPQVFFLPEPVDNTSENNSEPKIQALISDGQIRQLMDLELPENVKIIIQTGGAGAWDMTQINPNRSQRFLLEAGNEGLQEISDSEIVNMASRASMTDFLSFCRENYPADHEVVCFVDHGGASSGFGLDENFDDLASLERIKSAFMAACKPDEENPPFEMIDFQCCLMSSAEVASYLKGFARYMTCAEETTFSYLRNSGVEITRDIYEAMSDFLKDTTQNGALIGRYRADAYAKYMVYGAQLNGMISGSDTGVLDLTKAGQIYEKYNALAAKMLAQAVKNPAWLSVYSQAANASIFMAGDAFKAYNTIDLELLMENLSPYFPEETKAVIDAVEESVLYRRTSSYMNGTHGISIYFPAHVEGTGGLDTLINYLEHVTDSPDIRALYYYKAFGCMPDDLVQYCSEKGYGDVKAIDFTPMNSLAKLPVELDDTRMSVTLSKEQAAITSKVLQEFGQIDEEKGVIKYYGRDQYIGLDSEDPTKVISDFENKWMTLNGQPLYLKIINSTAEAITYVTPIEYMGLFDRDLLLSYDFETEEVKILGMKRMNVQADTLDVALEPLNKGDIIIPVHYEASIDGGTLESIPGTPIIFDEKTKLEEVTVSDGKYIERIVYFDLRSDEYYSYPICFTMKDGAASEIGKAPHTVYFSKIWD